MSKKAQVKTETRGRKKSGRPIAKNGLFEDQWERILTDANAQGYGSGIVLLRQIVQQHYDRLDQIADQGTYSHEENFVKLPITKKS